MYLPLTSLALVASLHLPTILAAPTCGLELGPTDSELRGYGASLRHYCKRSPAPAADIEGLPEEVDDLQPINVSGTYLACYAIYSSARVRRALNLDEAGIEKRCGKAKTKRTAEPDPLMIADPFGLDDGEDGGGSDGGVGPWGGTPEPGPINAGAAYKACYVIYSSARVKREVGLDDAEIEKRCSKAKAKRSAEPEPLMIADPTGLDGGLDGGGGGDGGPEPQWPGDVGDGFLQCYSTYTSDKKARDLGEEGLEKRCGKAKRDLEDAVIAKAKREPLMIADPFHDPDGGGGPPLGGSDGGTWPGDVGDGFLQCYSTYTTDKRVRDLGDEGLKKRCRKEKREAEDMLIKREVGDEVFERDMPKYDDYDEYGSVPV